MHVVCFLTRYRSACAEYNLFPIKSIVVLHTHGRTGQYHPHLHLLATSGGYDGPGECWEHLTYLPYELLRRTWQWHLLTMLRQTLKTEAIHQLVDACFRKYPNGLVTNVQKGQVSPHRRRVWRVTWPAMW